MKTSQNNQSSTLNKTKSDLVEAKEYLVTIETQILIATTAGNDALRDLQREVEEMQIEKASLIKELLSIRQDIRLAKQRH